MMGADVDAPCDCCELLFEVVERSTASLNSFTCFGEAAPGLLGGGGAFLTVSVEPMLIACHLSRLPLCPDFHIVVDCRAKSCDGRHSSQRHARSTRTRGAMRVWGTYGWEEVAPPGCVKRATPSEPLRLRRDKTGRAKLRRPREAGGMEQNRACPLTGPGRRRQYSVRFPVTTVLCDVSHSSSGGDGSTLWTSSQE